jgi:hypothetical protein
MTTLARQFLSAIFSSLDDLTPMAKRIAFSGEGTLPSVYAVTDLAAASIGAACLSVARLAGDAPVLIDRRRASLWFT